MLSYQTVTVLFDSFGHKQLLNSALELPTFPDDVAEEPPAGISDVSSQPNSRSSDFLVDSQTHYQVHFKLSSNMRTTDWVAEREFGYNSLFKRDITPDSLCNLSEMSIKIRYRHHSIPWASATTIEDEIAKHFDELIFIPENNRPPNCW